MVLSAKLGSVRFFCLFYLSVALKNEVLIAICQMALRIFSEGAGIKKCHFNFWGFYIYKLELENN